MNWFDKARAAGCEEHHIARAQLDFDSNFGRTIDIHESSDQVNVHAAWFEAGGKSVSLGHIGITTTESGAVLWRRMPPGVPAEKRKAWNPLGDAWKGVL